MKVSLEHISPDNKGIFTTVKRAKELVNKSLMNYKFIEFARNLVKNVSGKDDLAKAYTIWKWVKNNVKYQKDPIGVELIQSPEHTLKVLTGDCDDHTILVSALNRAVGIPTRMVVLSQSMDGTFTHIYPEVLIKYKGKEMWVPSDTTIDKPFGYKHENYTNKQVIENDEDEYKNFKNFHIQYEVGGMVGQLESKEIEKSIIAITSNLENFVQKYVTKDKIAGYDFATLFKRFLIYYTDFVWKTLKRFPTKFEIGQTDLTAEFLKFLKSQYPDVVKTSINEGLASFNMFKTIISFQGLLKSGFSKEEAEKELLLTPYIGETPDDYANRVISQPVARKIYARAENRVISFPFLDTFGQALINQIIFWKMTRLNYITGEKKENKEIHLNTLARLANEQKKESDKAETFRKIEEIARVPLIPYETLFKTLNEVIKSIEYIPAVVNYAPYIIGGGLVILGLLYIQPFLRREK